MTPALRIISPGLSTTIQDVGRSGFQRLGVSVSGALDRYRFTPPRLAGNPGNTGALEALYVGPTFAVDTDDTPRAAAGADAALELLDDAHARCGELIPTMRSARVRRAPVIRVRSLTNRATHSIAVDGGFPVAPALGSVSTDSRGRMGGWQARPLLEGDVILLRRATAIDRDEYLIEGLDLAAPRRFRAVLGPQSDNFSDQEIERFFASEYTMSAGSNRMGMRLEGQAIGHLRGFNIVSDAIATGSIQVPGSGQPIVLLADHQTTGGYPKIATVISADLPALGRVPIGASIAFERVTVEEAAAARRELAATVDGIAGTMVRLSIPATAVAERLLSASHQRRSRRRGVTRKDRLAMSATEASRAAGPAARGTSRRARIMFGIGATVMFAISNAISKWVVASYPVGEVMFARSLSSLIVCSAFMLPVTGLAVFATRRVRDHLARGLSQAICRPSPSSLSA